MAFFPDAWLDELRARSDIVSIVSRYVPLKQKGRRYWACCPFHGEKTPSFSVNSDTQLYYCFGCKKAGNIIGFVMDMERLDFVEAVRLLAEQAHMDLPEEGNQGEQRKRREERENLKKMLRDAALYYVAQLSAPGGQAAREYLRRRGLSEGIMRRFGLGFAPEGWQSLLAHLTEKGYAEQDIKRAGLASEKNGRYYDVFRNRVMFPIITPRGDVVGFGGRVMDDSQPKYLNSPETPLFNKRQHLYGLNLVKKAAGSPRLILVEGYMDVVSLHRYGFGGAVAALGTALTEEQARLLKRYGDTLALAFDGDEAGRLATQRALEVLAAGGMKARVAVMAGAKDPDEFIRAKGSAAFERVLETALTPTEFNMSVEASKVDMSTQDGRSAYAIACAKLIAGITDPVERERYLKQLQISSGFSLDSLTEQLRHAQRGGEAIALRVHSDGNNRDNNAREHHADARGKAAAAALAALAFGRLSPGALEDADFSDPAQKRLLAAMKAAIESEPGLDAAALCARIEDGELSRALAELVQTQESFITDDYVSDCLHLLKQRTIHEQILSIRQELGQAGLNIERRTNLMVRLQSLLQQVRTGPCGDREGA